MSDQQLNLFDTIRQCPLFYSPLRPKYFGFCALYPPAVYFGLGGGGGGEGKNLAEDLLARPKSTRGARREISTKVVALHTMCLCVAGHRATDSVARLLSFGLAPTVSSPLYVSLPPLFTAEFFFQDEN